MKKISILIDNIDIIISIKIFSKLEFLFHCLLWTRIERKLLTSALLLCAVFIYDSVCRDALNADRKTCDCDKRTLFACWFMTRKYYVTARMKAPPSFHTLLVFFASCCQSAISCRPFDTSHFYEYRENHQILKCQETDP